MKELVVSLVASAKLIGAGMATIGITGAGIGIGVLFGFFILFCIIQNFVNFKKKNKKIINQFKNNKKIYNFIKDNKRFFSKKNDEDKSLETDKKSYLINFFKKISFDLATLYKIYRWLNRFFFYLLMISSILLLLFNDLYALELKELFCYLFVSLFLFYIIILQFLKLNFSIYLDSEFNKFFFKNLVMYILNLTLFFLLIVFSVNTEYNKITTIFNLNINIYFFLLLITLLITLFYLILLNYGQLDKKVIDQDVIFFIQDKIDNTFIRKYLEPLFNFYEKFIFYKIIYFFIIFKLIYYFFIFFFENLYYLNILNDLFLYLIFFNTLIYLIIWLVSDVFVFFLVLPNCVQFSSPLDYFSWKEKKKVLIKQTLIRRSLVPLVAFFGSFITYNFVHQLIWPDFEPPIKKLAEQAGFQQYMRNKFDYPPMSWKIEEEDQNQTKD